MSEETLKLTECDTGFVVGVWMTAAGLMDGWTSVRRCTFEGQCASWKPVCQTGVGIRASTVGDNAEEIIDGKRTPVQGGDRAGNVNQWTRQGLYTSAGPWQRMLRIYANAELTSSRVHEAWTASRPCCSTDHLYIEDTADLAAHNFMHDRAPMDAVLHRHAPRNSAIRDSIR